MLIKHVFEKMIPWNFVTLEYVALDTLNMFVEFYIFVSKFMYLYFVFKSCFH